MRRRGPRVLCLSAAVLTGSLAVACASAARAGGARDEEPLAVRRLAEGVYAVPGDSGRGSEGRANAGFVVTGDGVLVVDALASPAQGRRLVAAVGSVTPLPIRWLVLTHHHPDHHFGAAVLRERGARVLAHPNRSTLAGEDGEDTLLRAWSELVGEEEMRGFAFADVPDVPVTADTAIETGGRRVELLFAGRAHTPGDVAVWLPGARVLFAGDLLIEDGVSMVADGDSGVLLEALERLEGLGARTVVPGHGRISEDPPALFERTRHYVEGLRTRMRQALRTGESLNDVVARMPAADPERPVSRPARERRNAVRVYLEMEREFMGLDPLVDPDATEAGSGAPPAR
ncbi:MAG: MBL fold metallo-hydrolase [Gemmatimonadota bacterium]